MVTLLVAGEAEAAMAKEAVIWEGLITLTLETAISGEEVETEAPERKLEPLRVTEKEEPTRPLEGLMEAREGGAALTEKEEGEVVPPEVVTVTLKVPREALAAMEKVAVI